MAREDDTMIVERRTVLIFDICSSSNILEDLIARDNMCVWRNLHIKLKEFLNEQSQLYNYKVYKFVGDGWIVLFDQNVSGKILIEFAEKLSCYYRKLYSQKIAPKLESTQSVVGLTFGVEKGQLVRFVMRDKKEYVGRPINIAARLQSSIKGRNPEYKLVMPAPLYTELKEEMPERQREDVITRLKNINHGSKFRCVQIQLHSRKLVKRKKNTLSM